MTEPRRIRVALTFDDGPSAWTAPLLDLLAAHGAHATFFVIGSHAVRRPRVVRRIVDDGHELGNHTWSHPRLARDCDDRRVHEELEQTSSAISRLVGSPPRLYRAPHFDVDARVDAIAADLGLDHVAGTVSPPDWHDAWSAPLTTTFVLPQLQESSVVVLHDGAPPGERRSPASFRATLDAVAVILRAAGERELELVPAGRLLTAGTTA